MNILVVSATKEELKTLNNIEVLITGVGIPNTIFKLTNHLKTGHSEDCCRSRGSIRNRGIIQHDIPVYYGIVSNSCA